jgi:uncharacterized protein YydD (DUF2326 family)
MRLISLTANKDSFRPIFFKRSGLTLIVGKQKNPEKSDSGRTYNGVGKSLAIGLVHFCLGAGVNNKLEEAIPDWEFNLTFELDDKQFISTRNTSSQNKMFLNDEEMSLAKFRSKLEETVFELSSPVKGITFRSLLDKFVRPRKGSYISFDQANDKVKNDYYNLLCNAFLLGIDIDLIITKHDLKIDRDRIKTFRENLNDDLVFREFFTDNKNIDIELQDLEDKINQLTNDLAKFEIADNYNEIKKEAEHTKRLLQEARNTEVVLTNAINHINRSLELRPDISEERLLRIYKEARAALPDNVVKQINDVTEFHNKLLENRLKRLNAEKTRLEKELKSVRKDVASFSRKRDSQIKFLGTHGALDDWATTSNYLSDFKSKAQKIRDYKDLLQRYSDQTQEINIKLSNETIKANTYLRQATTLLDENRNRFRSFSKRFYPDKPGGLTVTNNEGDNQLRFNVDAKIQDDASDGINEVKIFCFDMTLLMGRRNHKIEFLFHDSRLFSDMDPRQRATLFKLAYECTHQSDTQYIATLNEDQIMSMKDQFTDQEFTEKISDNIVLELTDEAPSGKLLGIQVDMQYE